jgi:DNA-binding MarR family transcriptional regulator
MNAFFFGTKRAFHGVLRVMRKPLQSRGLTAARFDMMYALMPTHDAVGRTVRQSDLRRMLGVSAPVVARMLRSLEALGWVARQRPPCGDRRQVDVSLTAAGIESIRAAGRTLMRASKRLLYEAICFGWPRRKSARTTHLLQLEAYLCGMRGTYGDQATLWYPWEHPEDFCAQEDEGTFGDDALSASFEHRVAARR